MKRLLTHGLKLSVRCVDMSTQQANSREVLCKASLARCMLIYGTSTGRTCLLKSSSSTPGVAATSGVAAARPLASRARRSMRTAGRVALRAGWQLPPWLPPTWRPRWVVGVQMEHHGGGVPLPWKRRRSSASGVCASRAGRATPGLTGIGSATGSASNLQPLWTLPTRNGTRFLGSVGSARVQVALAKP